MPLPLAGFLVGTAFGRFLQVVLLATVGKILLGIGLAVVTFTGVTIAINGLKVAFTSMLSSAPADLITILQIGGFINATNMMIAAMVAVTTIKTVTGAIKKLKFT